MSRTLHYAYCICCRSKKTPTCHACSHLLELLEDASRSIDCYYMTAWIPILVLGFVTACASHGVWLSSGPTVPVGGIAFSLDNSVFLPRNSLHADVPTPNTSPFLCHSQQASPMWVDSGNVTVSTNTNSAVHQLNSTNTTELVVTNVSEFQNGVYKCINSAGDMSSLGIFIRQPGTYVRIQWRSGCCQRQC